jgi:hypothetical protein
MAGQRQKPADQLAFKRGGRGRVLEVVPEEEAVAHQFPVPEGLSPEAEYVWVETMEVAKRSLFPTDFFQARRWIFWVDRWLKEVAALAGEDSVVWGATGMVRNPRYMVIRQIEANIVHAEQVMGLDPRARMRLGITYSQEQSALAKLKEPASERRRPVPLRRLKAGAK